MVCWNCFGLIIISLTCFLIGLLLVKRFYDERNQFTLYMVFFFLLAGFGWFVWFLSTEMVLDIYNQVKYILMIIGLLPQLVLLIFVLTFYEVSLGIRIILIIVTVLLSILHLFFTQYRISTILSTLIIIFNGGLFILNWKKNDDLKSLLFAIGLFLILIGESLTFLSKLVQGIFLTIVAIIWFITYAGILERIMR